MSFAFNPLSGRFDIVTDLNPVTSNVNLGTYAITQTATAGENLVAGNLCYLKSDGKFWKADNSSVNTASTTLLMANASITADTTGEFIMFGQFTIAGLTAGSVYFVGSAGAITTTKPTTQDYVVRPIGTALSTTVLMFTPGPEWITYKV